MKEVRWQQQEGALSMEPWKTSGAAPTDNRSNPQTGSQRQLRTTVGATRGAWDSFTRNISARERLTNLLPTSENRTVGFRVSSIPEPSTALLVQRQTLILG